MLDQRVGVTQRNRDRRDMQRVHQLLRCIEGTHAMDPIFQHERDDRTVKTVHLTLSDLVILSHRFQTGIIDLFDVRRLFQIGG